MSVAVAVRKGNEIVIAADTQTNFGSSKVNPVNHRAQKIRTFGTSFLATTGWGIYDNILDDIAARGKLPSLTTRKSIFAFFLKMWRTLHAKYPFVNDQSDKEHESPFADLGAAFLLANRGGIFYVAGDLSVTEFKEYYAVGSGCDFALGALHALYSTDADAAAMAHKAVGAAIEFNLYCGGDVQLERIRLPARR